MKTYTLFSIGASLLTSGVLAGQYSASMTKNGVEVPFEITELPYFDRLPKYNSSARQSKRSGPISVTPNWAGAIQESPVAGDFHTIIADWRVPGIYPPPGAAVTSTQKYVLLEWVGLGSDCGVIFQAGTGQDLEGNSLEQFVWWEWFPDNAIQKISVPISYMDKFRVTLTATNPSNGVASGGVAIIENETQGFTFTLTATDFSNVCLDNAEWIVENPFSSTLAWPTFENVDYTECEAFTTTGAQQGITGTTAVHAISIDGRTIVSEYEDNEDFYVQP